jgi:hypothetical protein
MGQKGITACYNGLAKLAVQFSANSFVIAESSGLRMKFIGKKSAPRVAANRRQNY